MSHGAKTVIMGGWLDEGNSWGIDGSQTLDAAQTLVGTGSKETYGDVMLSTYVVGGDATLYVDFSWDGSNWDSTLSYNIVDSTHAFHTLVKGYRWCRVRLTAGSSNLTTVRHATEYGLFRQPTQGLQSALGRDADAAAVRPTDFYQEVQESRRTGYSFLTKFGRNSDIDTGSVPEDIWEGGGVYTGQPTSFTPETVDVFSSSADDTSAGTGAQTVRITGLKSSTSTAYETEDITMNGTTAVTSTNTWWRVNRLFVLTAGSGGENAGTITCRSTTTTANVFASVPAAYNQSQIAAWTVPAGVTAYMKRVQIAMTLSAGSSGSAQVSIRVRNDGGVYRAIRIFEINSNQGVEYTALGGEILPAGTDIKVMADDVSSNNTIIDATLEILLVDN